MNRPTQPGVAQTLSYDEKKSINIEHQAMLKSIIESGAAPELWDELCKKAYATLQFRVKTAIYEVELEFFNQAQTNVAQQQSQ